MAGIQVSPTAFLTPSNKRTLRKDYKETSKHVVHFSSKRTGTDHRHSEESLSDVED